MKRKLLLSIFIIMFVFILNVKAEDLVKIKSVELIDKSEAVKEIEEPKHNGLNLDLNLQLFKVGNYAEYKITIENLTNEEVKIKNNGKNVTTKNENITYNYIWDNNDSTIKSKQTKSFTLKVEYTKEIAETSYDADGNYIATDSLKIEMSQEQQTIPASKTTTKNKIKKKEESPQTGDIVIDYIVLIVIAITLIFDIVYYAIVKKDNKKFNKFILVGSFILLLTSIIIKETYAFTYAEMNVTTNIKISKLPKMMPVCDSYLISDEILEAYISGNDMPEEKPADDNCFNWEDIIGYINTEEAEEIMSLYVNPNKPEPDDLLTKLIVTTTSEMPEEYEYNNMKYTLENTEDVSEKQNDSVIIGVYKNTSDGMLILLGGDGGVAAPDNSASLFSGESITTNKGIPLILINYLDLNNLDVSNVTNMTYMFYYNLFLKSNDNFKIETWNTKNLKYMFEMFLYFACFADTVNLDLNYINTSAVTVMDGLFDSIGSESNKVTLDISKWDTSNVISMAYMFAGTNIETLDLSNFDTSNVTKMNVMFSEYKGTELDLSSFDTSNVTNMRYMFEDSSNLETIYVSNKWNTSKVTDSNGMFDGCSKLKGGAGTTFDSSKKDKTYAHVDEGESNPGYLTLKTN